MNLGIGEILAILILRRQWNRQYGLTVRLTRPRCGNESGATELLPGGLGQGHFRGWFDLDAVGLVRDVAQILDRVQRLAGRVERHLHFLELRPRRLLSVRRKAL